MAQTAAQMWKSSTFTIDRHDSVESGEVDFRLSGPFTMRDMYSSMSPEAFERIFASALSGKAPRLHRIDLSQVPYMDSTGLGVLVRLYARCQAKSIPMIVTGASPRVLQLFRITKVDELFQPTAVV